MTSDESRDPVHAARPSGAAAATEAAEEQRYGFPVRLWRGIGRRRPPLLPTPSVWRSPLRGPWLTSVFGLVLLVTLPIVTVTGLLSYVAYGPISAKPVPAMSGGCTCPRSRGRPGPRGSTGSTRERTWDWASS